MEELEKKLNESNIGVIGASIGHVVLRAHLQVLLFLMCLWTASVTTLWSVASSKMRTNNASLIGLGEH